MSVRRALSVDPVNLLKTLLGFAYGEEDPVTEMLAWFLRMSPHIRTGLLDAFDAVVRRSGSPLPRTPEGKIDEPTVQTQLIAANPRGTACRYDLVCDWHSPRVRLIIEVKIWASLTWGVDAGVENGEAAPAHQVSRYLAVAAGSPEIRRHVVVLAPYAVDLGFGTAAPPGFAGQLPWQAVHDAMARTVATGDLAGDPTMMTLARNFVHLLETKRMAVPKLTFDVLTSVSRYRQFEKSARMMLTHARDSLVGDDGALKGFFKGNATAWQDDHDRIGWRIWVDAKDVSTFAFVGIHVGQDTIHEEVPDLYLFVQAKKGSDAQKALDARGDAIRGAIEALTTETTRAYHHPGGWEIYGIRRSLVEIARATDPADATTAFFRECVSSKPGNELLAMYLAALRTGAPTTATPSSSGGQEA